MSAVLSLSSLAKCYRYSIKIICTPIPNMWEGLAGFGAFLKFLIVFLGRAYNCSSVRLLDLI